MPAIVLVGAQWGDEGKGKATDLLGEQRRLRRQVQRRQQRRPHRRHRGPRRPREKYALHLLPERHPHARRVTPVIGNGVVVDLAVLFQEIDGLEARGVDTSRLVVSRERARHRALQPHPRQGDRAVPRLPPDRHDRPRHRPDLRRQDEPRRHPRAGPLRREHPAAEGRGRPRRQEPGARQDLQPPGGPTPTTSSRSCSRTPSGCARWSRDTSLLLEQALDRGDDRAARGRPGDAARRRPRHLPVRHVVQRHRRRRVHRFRASRRPGSTRVIAILKAYTTRVGEGPFPTELFDDDGEYLRKTGAEYGTTTGRPRRCGWMDTVIGRYATRINGVTDFVITKLDVLTGLDKVPICVAYEVDGVRHDEMPMSQSDFHHAEAGLRGARPAGGRTSPSCRDVRRAAGQRPALRRCASRS